MEKICLDPEVTVDFLRGEKGIVEKLKNYSYREEICIDALTLFYLHKTIKKQEIVEALESNMTILPFDSAAASKAAEINYDLKEKGIEKPNDIVLTAAICIAKSAFLFTKERKKFEGIKGLKLV